MKLFESGKIGTMKVKNRLVLAPMGLGRMCDPDGNWGERVKEYYAARARGGVGLVTTGLVFVSRKFEPMSRNQLDPHSQSHLNSLQEVAEVIHRSKAKLSVQLTAGIGRVAQIQPGFTPISSSATFCYNNPRVKARSITTQEIEELIEAFGTAAKNCRMASVDAIELHGHEGFLLDQFMSGIWNQRSDRFGGNRENRLNFAREIIATIKREAGKDFPVIYRFGADHYFQGGRTLAESIWISEQLVKMGVDALHIDAGCYETKWWAHPPTYQPSGCMVNLAKEIKRAVTVPVITVGKLHYPVLAEKILEEGKADFIALGRGLLADPDWPNKVLAGKIEDIRPCISDHEGCSREIARGHAVSCTLNPECGHEKEWALTPVKRKKNLLVIGGGPAGMEASIIASLRGIKVTLWEKTDSLGGNLILASIPNFKKDLRDFITYQKTQLTKLPVEIITNLEATRHNILNTDTKCVIIATGAQPNQVKVPGANKCFVMTAEELLSNHKEVGGKVVIVGGGFIGCETAIYLAQQGIKVTLTSRRDELLTDMDSNNKAMLFKMMDDYKVNILTNTHPVEVTDSGILVNKDNNEVILSVENVIFSVGMSPCNQLKTMLEDKVPELYTVGDCVQPRLLINAIWEAHHVARQIEG